MDNISHPPTSATNSIYPIAEAIFTKNLESAELQLTSLLRSIIVRHDGKSANIQLIEDDMNILKFLAIKFDRYFATQFHSAENGIPYPLNWYLLSCSHHSTKLKKILWQTFLFVGHLKESTINQHMLLLALADYERGGRRSTARKLIKYLTNYVTRVTVRLAN